ncbi:baseplate complex protein [Acerihabitans arboris]|uniref:Uncharacterized protein n=1 Tax=Acerihabitans arboris TaxID=2691583 RepID=A0A845SI69_9GAMM|nr:hypothetical protein [Acerihabitans arboris]NDL64843.1 hypothetical protein [Acerihabitans arboris]
MTQIIMLALDGEAIPLRAIRVSPSMNIQDKDQSGQTSGTATAEQGVKAKELKVTGMIPFVEKAALTRLFELAEAKGDNGAARRYRVASPVAQAIKFREGIFSGDVSAEEQDNKMAWQISFTLKEQVSVAEKTAARSSKTTTTTQTADGATTDSGAGGDAPDHELTGFEKWLSSLNDKIGS